MIKRDITSAIIYPLLFGLFGLLYSSRIAAIYMFIINLVVSVAFIILDAYDSIFIFYLLQQPFVILWSVLLVKSKNDESLQYLDDLKIGGEALKQVLAATLCTLSITALISQFDESNIFSTNYYAFILLLTISLAIIYNIIERKGKDEKLTEK